MAVVKKSLVNKTASKTAKPKSTAKAAKNSAASLKAGKATPLATTMRVRF